MQTFLPYPDFAASARCLDRQRLGKQRVEALQILRTLTGASDGWRNHPAVRMWTGFDWALREYGLCCIAEWRYRGYKNTIDLNLSTMSGRKTPPWLGDPAFHASHRSNLLRKLPEHYGAFGWSENPDLEYVWPC